MNAYVLLLRLFRSIARCYLSPNKKPCEGRKLWAASFTKQCSENVLMKNMYIVPNSEYCFVSVVVNTDKFLLAIQYLLWNHLER